MSESSSNPAVATMGTSPARKQRGSTRSGEGRSFDFLDSGGVEVYAGVVGRANGEDGRGACASLVTDGVFKLVA